MQRARDRSFFVSTAITIGIIVVVVVFPRAPNFGADEYQVAFAGLDGAAVQAVARTQAELADVDLTLVEVADANEAEALVREGKLDAYLEGDSRGRRARPPSSLRAVLENAHSAVSGTRALEEAGIDPEQGDIGPRHRPARTGHARSGADERTTRGGIAFIGVLVLYGQLLGYGFWVALGVVEEKSSRVVEVLLSAIPARALLAGKVLGIGLLGLTQLLVISIAAVGAATLAGSLAVEASMLQPIGLVLGWFVLGYVAYACLSAAAARASRGRRSSRNATTPLTMLAMVSFFASFYLLQPRRRRTDGRLPDPAGQRAGDAHPDGSRRCRALGGRPGPRADGGTDRGPGRGRRSGLRGRGAADGSEGPARRGVAFGAPHAPRPGELLGRRPGARTPPRRSRPERLQL